MWDSVSEAFPWIKPDSVFGDGMVGPHLLFTWQKACSEERLFGHYDILVPSTISTSLKLPQDAACLEINHRSNEGGEVLEFTYKYSIYIYSQTRYLNGGTF